MHFFAIVFVSVCSPCKLLATAILLITIGILPMLNRQYYSTQGLVSNLRKPSNNILLLILLISYEKRLHAFSFSFPTLHHSLHSSMYVSPLDCSLS